MLLAKVENPIAVGDYRSIASYATLYKCIKKMMCDRLSEFLSLLVGENQDELV